MVRPLKGLGRKPKNVSLPVSFFEEGGEIELVAHAWGDDFSAFVEWATGTLADAIRQAGRTLDAEEARLTLLRRSDDVDRAIIKEAEHRIRIRQPRIEDREKRVDARRSRARALKDTFPTPESLADAHAHQTDVKLREMAAACGHDPDVVVELAGEARRKKQAAEIAASLARRKAQEARVRGSQANLLVTPAPKERDA